MLENENALVKERLEKQTQVLKARVDARNYRPPKNRKEVSKDSIANYSSKYAEEWIATGKYDIAGYIIYRVANDSTLKTNGQKYSTICEKLYRAGLTGNMVMTVPTLEKIVAKYYPDKLPIINNLVEDICVGRIIAQMVKGDNDKVNELTRELYKETLQRDLVHNQSRDKAQAIEFRTSSTQGRTVDKEPQVVNPPKVGCKWCGGRGTITCYDGTVSTCICMGGE